MLTTAAYLLLLLESAYDSASDSGVRTKTSHCQVVVADDGSQSYLLKERLISARHRLGDTG